jgi:hypothetical protein
VEAQHAAIEVHLTLHGTPDAGGLAEPVLLTLQADNVGTCRDSGNQQKGSLGWIAMLWHKQCRQQGESSTQQTQCGAPALRTQRVCADAQDLAEPMLLALCAA